MSTIRATSHLQYKDSSRNIMYYTFDTFYNDNLSSTLTMMFGNATEGEVYYLTGPFDQSSPRINAELIGKHISSGGISSEEYYLTQDVTNKIKQYGLLCINSSLDYLEVSYNYNPIREVSIASTNIIDEGITVSWTTTGEQSEYILQLIKENNILTRTGTTEKVENFTYSEIPENGTYKYLLTVKDSHNNSITEEITCTLKMLLFVNNFALAGENLNLDSDLVFTWAQPALIDAWTLNCKLNNVVLKSYTGTTAGLTIPHELSEEGTYTFEIIVSKKGSSVSSSIEKELEKVNVSITSVALSSAEVERGTNITTTVVGTNISSYTVNILNTGNTLIKSNVGSTFSTSDLEAGSYKAQIVAVHTNGYYTTTDIETITFKITQLTPVITNATLSSSRVEKGISLTSTVTGENVTGHTVNILDENSNLIASNVGTTFSTANLPQGNYKAQIKAYYTKANAYTSYSAPAIIDFTVFTYNAEITSIWPNTTRELRKSNIQIGFSAKNFTNYVISAIQNGVTKYTNSGTSASNIDEVISKSYTMINSLFDEGTVTLTVSISNVRSNYTTTDTMTVTFTVIDNPNTPIISYEQTYSTPKPMLYCNCTSIYVSYQIAIDDVVTSEIFGVISKYYFDTALENNVYHTFKVRVKNTYGLWSEWASATFYVSYAELEIPNFNVYADIINGCICVAMESQSQENFVSHSVLRLENGIWVEIGKDLERICTFYDDSCASSTVYSYKVRANDIYGGYKDSDSVEMAVDFSGTILSVPWTTEKLKLEYYANSDDITKSVSPNNKDTYVEVCGLSLPKLKRGTLKYKTLQLNIVFKSKEKYEEFINFIKNDVLLFRDGKGLKMYCHIVVSSEQDYIYYYKSVTVDITEVYYKEGDYIEVVDKPFMWAVEEY